MYIEKKVISKWDMRINQFFFGIGASVFWAFVIMVPLCLINIGNWIDGQWWNNLIGVIGFGLAGYLGWRNGAPIYKFILEYGNPYTEFIYPEKK